MKALVEARRETGMEFVEANGARIPAIGLGTWTLRGRECAEMVGQALALGYRHVDTAANYGNEAAVGEGISGAGLARDALFVTTKVPHTSLASADLRAVAEASLDRLRLDHVDLLLIHWPNPAIPIAETMTALNRARSDGLTRHIGVSNFTTRLLAEAIACSDAPLVTNQVEYHPFLDQAKALAACRAAGMALTSYCPLHRGGALFGERVVADAAAAHGRTPAQIVLRWHVQQEGVAAIPRTTRKERLSENLAVFDFRLSEAEMAAISALTSANRRLCNFSFSPRWDEP